MNENLSLPEFDIPDIKHKPLTSKEYYLLNFDGVERLHKSGQLKKLLADPRRMPVDVRFKLI